jgi:hypothetical protein
MSNSGDLFWGLIWLFFVLSSLQPVLQQRMLEATRQRKIARFERKRGSRVIVMVHRQETMRLLGFPIVRYIDINDSEEILRAIRLTDSDVPIDLIIHTPGGLVLAALQIARALREHRGKVTIFVPHYAMSGGTLICLASNEIVMSPHAVLGPSKSPSLRLMTERSFSPISGAKQSGRLEMRLVSCWRADYPGRKRRNWHKGFPKEPGRTTTRSLPWKRRQWV